MTAVRTEPQTGSYHEMPSHCIVPGCRRRVYTRGNCNSCYQTLRKAKAQGLITDEEAVKAGLILPVSRPKHNPMAQAIEAALRTGV